MIVARTLLVAGMLAQSMHQAFARGSPCGGEWRVSGCWGRCLAFENQGGQKI